MSTLPDKQAEILHKLDVDGLLSTALMVVGTHAFSTYKWPTNAIFPAGHEETQGFASTWCRDTPASLTLTGPDVDNTKRKTFFSVLRGFGPSYKINPCKPFQAMNAYGYEVELLAAPSFHPLSKDNLRPTFDAWCTQRRFIPAS